MNKQLPNPLYTIQNPQQITSLIFSKYNCDILYVGTRNGEFYEYDLQIRRPINKQLTNGESLNTILEIDEATILLYCRNGSLFKLSRIEKCWKIECAYQNDNFTFCKICVSLEKQILFIPSKETSVINCVDLNKFNLLNELKRTETKKLGMLMCMEVIDKDLLLSSYENGDLALFNINNFTQIDFLNVFNDIPLLCFDFSNLLNIGIAASAELIMRKFKIENFKINLFEELIELKNPGINSIKIRNCDNKIFASAGWDSRIRVYSLKKCKLLLVIDFHKEAVNCLDFSQNKILVAGSNEGLLTFWNLYNN